eukprot:CAMPEP_0174300444 /NCGR_PEP_ID=MMETSP0809-20121228/58463_1 /TAXON_ID=73025 ORGANISM="Eutreptiella gymnastica-like, Strain CCMP1594" /NCGR_SAMPLE_ID=MMETSP0809 /ASSEMBLY_ACC=CAM_ASM_000658 /LENGTH=227 /DNA_ID=CAMNT_0015406017 /DNA_START=1213 /DNA_END=1896 /DNA_ORIENTATION=-
MDQTGEALLMPRQWLLLLRSPGHLHLLLHAAEVSGHERQDPLHESRGQLTTNLIRNLGTHMGQPGYTGSKAMQLLVICVAGHSHGIHPKFPVSCDQRAHVAGNWRQSGDGCLQASDFNGVANLQVASLHQHFTSGVDEMGACEANPAALAVLSLIRNLDRVRARAAVVDVDDALEALTGAHFVPGFDVSHCHELRCGSCLTLPLNNPLIPETGPPQAPVQCALLLGA